MALDMIAVSFGAEIDSGKNRRELSLARPEI
jgi:hypothetical protein